MGLRVLALALERPGLQDQQVLRVTREWNLEDIPLLPDKGGGIATRYEVTTGPATFLLDQGRIVSRWNGFASAAELDRAIHDLLQQAPTAPPVRLLYDDGL
jgi:peroxiredoxin